MFHHSTTVLPPARAEIATPGFLETLEPVRQWAISFDTSKYPGKLRAKHLSVTEDIECTGINHQNCHVNRLNMVTNQWISDKPMWGLKAIYGLGLCRCITSYHWSNSPQVIALVPSIPPGSRHLPTPPTRQRTGVVRVEGHGPLKRSDQTAGIVLDISNPIVLVMEKTF